MCSSVRPTEFLLFICVLTPVRVSGQLILRAQTGDSVLLPCIYSKAEPLPETASVFWRDNNNSVVLNIIRREPDTSNQNSKFKDRVIGSPQQFKAGNFSILLKDVTEADNSSYECNIPKVDFLQRLILKVSGERARATTPSPGSAGGAVVPYTTLLMTLLPLCVSLIWTQLH